MQHLRVFFLLIVCLHVNQVSCGWWDRVKAEASRIGDQVTDNLSVLGGDIERGVKHVGDQISAEYERVEPKVKSWFEREKEVIKYIDPPELQARLVNETTCIGLPHKPSLELDCTFNGESVNCTEPAQVGTQVHMKCADGYKPTHYHGYHNIECNSSFIWSNALWHCLADCGRQNFVGGQEFIAGGEEARIGEFAWHVGIYQLKEGSFQQICGGSLITPLFVLTAAHCFWDLNAKTVLGKELFSVAAGKFTIDYYTDDLEIQRRNLSTLHMGPRFKGDRFFMAYDIALLRLDNPIKLTPLVNIVCLDFENSLEPFHLIPGNNGSIAGWGITELNVRSEVLKSVRLPYIPVQTCEDIVEAKFLKYLTHDKFCGGYRNKGTSICPGDSGGGFAFPQVTPDGVRFYLHGIASVGHRARANTGIKCSSEQVAAFTKISLYYRWISDIVLADN